MGRFQDETASALIAIWQIENPDSPQTDAAAIESSLRDRRWWDLIMHFRYSASEAAAFQALEVIAPLMPRDALALQLADLYTGGKGSAVSDDELARLLTLFRHGHLRNTVPIDLPTQVRIFRGVRTRDEQDAQRRVSSGISWTLSRDVARNFALGLPGYKPKPDCVSGFPSIRGFIGSGLVARARLLAFFNDRLESECVVDPLTVVGIEISEFAI